MATAEPNAKLNYAGFWRRLLAYSVDVTVLTTIGLAVNPRIKSNNSLSGIVNFAISAFYFGYFWITQNGQTLGKRLMALRVIKTDGRNMDMIAAILRYVGYLLSGVTFGLGFLLIAFNKKKQGIHDKIANTVVVKTGEKPKIAIAFLIGCLPVIFLLVVLLAIRYL